MPAPAVYDPDIRYELDRAHKWVARSACQTGYITDLKRMKHTRSTIRDISINKLFPATKNCCYLKAQGCILRFNKIKIDWPE